MKYIFYVIFLVNIVFGNDDLNSYLNNKNLEHSIIKDEKNQRVIIDLLDNENRMIVFSKNSNGDYKKTFDEKLYFCKTSNIMWFQNIFIKNDYYIVDCFSNYVDRMQRDITFYFDNENFELLKIVREDADQQGVVEQSYTFTPKSNIPNLTNFKKQNFSEEYLSKNEKNFIQAKIITPQTLKELLDSVQNPQANTIASTDFNVILKNEPLNTKTLQKYNDIAYYLQQANANDEAIFLLEKIIEKFPNRTVAYLNLADAYVGINETEKAKVNYEKYIDLMKKSGKETKIPKRVLEYK